MTDDDNTLTLAAAVVMAAAMLFGWLRSMGDGPWQWMVVLGVLALYWTHTAVELLLLQFFP